MTDENASWKSPKSTSFYLLRFIFAWRVDQETISCNTAGKRKPERWSKYRWGPFNLLKPPLSLHKAILTISFSHLKPNVPWCETWKLRAENTNVKPNSIWGQNAEFRKCNGLAWMNEHRSQLSDPRHVMVGWVLRKKCYCWDIQRDAFKVTRTLYKKTRCTYNETRSVYIVHGTSCRVTGISKILYTVWKNIFRDFSPEVCLNAWIWWGYTGMRSVIFTKVLE